MCDGRGILLGFTGMHNYNKIYYPFYSIYSDDFYDFNKYWLNWMQSQPSDW